MAGNEKVVVAKLQAENKEFTAKMLEARKAMQDYQYEQAKIKAGDDAAKLAKIELTKAYQDNKIALEQNAQKLKEAQQAQQAHGSAIDKSMAFVKNITIAYVAFKASLSSLKEAFDLLEKSIQYIDTVGTAGADRIQQIFERTKGLISSDDILSTYKRMMAQFYQGTEEQQNNFFIAATVLAKKRGIDLKEALKGLMDDLTKGQGENLTALGIKLNENASLVDRQKEAYKKLGSVVEGVTIKLDTLLMIHQSNLNKEDNLLKEHAKQIATNQKLRDTYFQIEQTRHGLVVGWEETKLTMIGRLGKLIEWSNGLLREMTVKWATLIGMWNNAGSMLKKSWQGMWDPEAMKSLITQAGDIGKQAADAVDKVLGTTATSQAPLAPKDPLASGSKAKGPDAGKGKSGTKAKRYEFDPKEFDKQYRDNLSKAAEIEVEIESMKNKKLLNLQGEYAQETFNLQSSLYRKQQMLATQAGLNEIQRAKAIYETEIEFLENEKQLKLKLASDIFSEEKGIINEELKKKEDLLTIARDKELKDLEAKQKEEIKKIKDHEAEKNKLMKRSGAGAAVISKESQDQINKVISKSREVAAAIENKYAKEHAKAVVTAEKDITKSRMKEKLADEEATRSYVMSQREKQQALEEKQKADRQSKAEYITSIGKEITANIIAAKSAEDFALRSTASILTHIASIAWAQMTKNTALGLADLAEFNPGSAALHFAAAAGWGVLGGGLTAGASAISNAGSPDNGSSAGGYESTRITGGNRNSNNQERQPVNNFYINSRRGWWVKEDIKQIGIKMAKGRF